MDDSVESKVYKMEEVSKILGFSPMSIYRMLESGVKLD